MIRVGSQLTFCSPDKILRQTAVELNEQNVITRIFSLDEGNVETSNTLFFDGILSSGIVSLRQNNLDKKLLELLNAYQYFDLSESIPVIELKRNEKPLLLDFGLNSMNDINNLLPCLVPVLHEFSIFEIIAACTYYPTALLGQAAGLTENEYARLILWENVDLIQKTLTANTGIREIN